MPVLHRKAYGVPGVHAVAGAVAAILVLAETGHALVPSAATSHTQ